MNLKTVTEGVDTISRNLAILSGWTLLGLSLYIGVDVAGRKLFNLSLQGSDEIGGYLMAIICTFGFSYAASMRAHIRLNLILPKLSPKLQCPANLLAYFMLAVFSYMLLWRGVSLFHESYQLGAVAPTPLQTPLWIPQLLWSAGLVWFALQSSVYLLNALILAFTGRITELNTLLGIGTVAKEISRELEDVTTEQHERLKANR